MEATASSTTGRNTNNDAILILVPVATSVWMAYRARKKKSLTPAGCLTALGVGTVIGLLGGGGTATIQALLRSLPRPPRMMGKGSAEENAVRLISVSTSTVAKKIREALAAVRQTASPSDALESTAGSQESLPSGRLTRMRAAAASTTAVAKDTASRIVGENNLSALLLQKDKNGQIISEEPRQLLPFAALINFFFTSTFLTKKGAAIKKHQMTVIEEEAYEESGNRTALQVLCNGGPAAGLAVIVHACRTLRFLGFFASAPESLAEASEGSASFGLSSIASFPSNVVWYFATIPSSVLAAALIAQLAAAQGDTWSSEIGVLSRSAHARLIIGFRKVPRGTNGGVTPLGTGAALAAGAQLGGTLAVSQIAAMMCGALVRGDVSILSIIHYTVVEAAKFLIPSRALSLCRLLIRGVRQASSGGASATAVNAASSELGPLRQAGGEGFSLTPATVFYLCLFSSVGGSLLDSVLGQFLQASHEKIPNDSNSPSSSPSANDRASASADKMPLSPKTRHISGVNILSNHGVNFVTVLSVVIVTVAALHRHPSRYV